MGGFSNRGDRGPGVGRGKTRVKLHPPANEVLTAEMLEATKEATNNY